MTLATSRTSTTKFRALRRALFRSRPLCAICGGVMIFPGDRGYSHLLPNAATADHKIPVGGSYRPLEELDRLDMLQAACRACNRAKSNRVIDSAQDASAVPWLDIVGMP